MVFNEDLESTQPEETIMSKTTPRKNRNCTGLIQTFMTENYGHDATNTKTFKAHAILREHLKDSLVDYLWANCNDRNRADGLTGRRLVCGYTMSLKHHTRDEYLDIVVISVLGKKHVQISHVKGEYSKRIVGAYELETILNEFSQY